MGTYLEINDTLQLNESQGFPVEVLNYERHQERPIQLEEVADQVFIFRKSSARIFHLDPVRIYLAQNIAGKWLFWGQVLIQSQHIEKQREANGSWDGESWQTSGTFIIKKLYTPEYQRAFTRHEAPAHKCFFTETKP